MSLLLHDTGVVAYIKTHGHFIITASAITHTECTVSVKPHHKLGLSGIRKIKIVRYCFKIPQYI